MSALTVFRSLLFDNVIHCLLSTFKEIECGGDSISAYAQFVSELYKEKDACLAKYVEKLLCDSENVYVKAVGAGKTPSKFVEKSVEAEIKTLQEVCDLVPSDFFGAMNASRNIVLPEFECEKVNLKATFFERVKNIGKYGYGEYAKNKMFFVDARGEIVPVKNPDKTTLSMLVDYERERKIIIDNTKALLSGKPALNVLLTGDAGTGKSSTVKAIVNEFFDEGLRIIEVKKEQLSVIPQILDDLAENPLKFIIFIDDISFLSDDDNFNALKAVLEGSVSARSANVVIYATSNRVHMVKEKFSDRDGDDVHRNDTMEEIISLSERFGIHVTFQKPDKKTYLNIVSHLAKDFGIEMEKAELEMLAERFALERGGRSARVARQFVDKLLSEK